MAIDSEEYSDDGGVALPPSYMTDSESDAGDNQSEGLFDNNGPKSALPSYGSGELDSQRQNRSLFIRSLDKSTTSEHLQLHFSQVFPVKHAVIINDSKTGESNGYGFVTFGSETEAKTALEELHNSMLNGHKLKAEMAKPRDRTDQSTTTTGTIRKKPSHVAEEDFQSKLIVRNLPWSVKDDKALTALFQSYGKVLHAVVPKDKTGKLRGFGIIIIKGRKNAEAAKEAMDGKSVKGRKITVDWALERTEWAKKQEDAPDATPDSDLSEADNSEGSEDEDDDGEDGDEMDVDRDDNDEDSEEDREPEDLTPTLFVRNLPFECKDEDLFEHFKQFGRIRYARVVFGDVADRSRGTGFVCFVNPEEASACLRAAPRNSNDVISKGGDDKDKKKAAFHSVLQNDASDPSGQYTISGRVLQLSPAVAKGEAGRLEEENLKKRNQRDRDKRRLFLLQEAHIPTNSPLGKQLPPSDVIIRETSMKQRKKMLDTNPSLFVSLTRLSVRNLPRAMTSSGLKALARQAVVGYAVDVKSGASPALTRDELDRGGATMDDADRDRRARGKGIVKQTKIEFESKDGTKMKEGEGGRSRGYGFVEFYTHRTALMALRWMNGRPVSADVPASTEGGPKLNKRAVEVEGKKRPVVEFALENAQVINRRAQNEVVSREKGANFKSQAAGGSSSGGREYGGDRAERSNHRGFTGDQFSTFNRDGRTRGGKNNKRKRVDGGEGGNGAGAGGDSTENAPSGDKKSKKAKSDEPRSAKDDKLAKKNRIISKKRLLRKNRKA